MAVGGDVARRYHESTKHSYESVRRGARGLDWANKPHPYKEYVDVQAEPLPADLDRLLRFGAGVVRTRRGYEFRTYSSAGALYPIEVYVATPDGLYHFHPRELALRRIREGDYRAVLAEAAAAPELAEAGAILVLTGILWRTAWKYGLRGYRHLYWDAGTMLANLLALAPSPRLFTGFVDRDVNALLGVDGEREAALALLAVGRAERAPPAGAVEPLRLEAAPISRRERAYPEAHELHRASSLTSVEEVRRYRVEAEEAAAPLLDDETLERAIRRRGSARNFTPDAVPASELAAILAGAAAPIPADFPPANEIYLIANAVDGIEPGAYRFRPPEGFELLKPGQFRGWAAYLCLEQEHGGRAAATHFLMADLHDVLATLGERGYRAAQLEAGIRAGRIYVGAYARGLGATGLTFYDDDVSKFLTGETALAPMLCVAVGVDRR